MIAETDLRTEVQPTMTDRDVVRFVNHGYMLLEAVIPEAVNRDIMAFLEAGQEGGQNMLANGMIEQVTLNPDCLGVVRSLLGDTRRLAEMREAMLAVARPGAADTIAEELIRLGRARR